MASFIKKLSECPVCLVEILLPKRYFSVSMVEENSEHSLVIKLLILCPEENPENKIENREHLTRDVTPGNGVVRG